MGNEGHEGVHNLMEHSDYQNALSEPLIVIDCMATWCGPCKTIAPTIVKFAKEYPAAKFYKLDIDQVPDVAQELGIRAMPTFVIFKKGKKVGEVVGASDKALEAAIKKAVDSMDEQNAEL